MVTTQDAIYGVDEHISASVLQYPVCLLSSFSFSPKLSCRFPLSGTLPWDQQQSASLRPIWLSPSHSDPPSYSNPFPTATIFILFWPHRPYRWMDRLTTPTSTFQLLLKDAKRVWKQNHFTSLAPNSAQDVYFLLWVVCSLTEWTDTEQKAWEFLPPTAGPSSHCIGTEEISSGHREDETEGLFQREAGQAEIYSICNLLYV